MAQASHVVAVQIIAVHVQCTACGDRSRVVRHDDAWDKAFEPLGAWWIAHRQPRLALVEMTVNGQPATWTLVNR